MLKLIVKALWFIAALSLSGAACAMGMGGINVTTALGEPLNAEIQLLSVGKADKNSMSARLASPEAFKVAGLDYPNALPRLKFQIQEKPSGESYIKVTSAQEVNEPFVSILVELTWASGQLLREYTFLLDPPGFKPVQPKAVEVQPLEPSVATPDESGGGALKDQPMPMRATAPIDEKAFGKPAAAETGKTAESSNIASGVITVKRGDTLSRIASETKSSDVSLERMMVAMYRANADAFEGANMNRLKVGKILRVPEGDDLSKVGQVDALREVHVQAADWNAYRMKLAAASGTVAERTPKQESSGKIGMKLAEKTPAATESAREVVRLSKGQSPGDKAVAAGNSQAVQEKLHAMEEDATARSKTLKESKARIAILEKNINEMERLIELKGQSLPSAKPVQSKVEAPVPTKVEVPVSKPEIKPEVNPVAESAVPGLAPTVQPASAVKPIKPPIPKVVPPPPSLLDEIIDEPLYLAGGAAALLGLGGFGLMWSRRNKVRKNKEDEEALVPHIAAPIVPSPDTGDFTQTVTIPGVASPSDPDDVDPISEADLFMNFGRDAQAEEILNEALKKTPGNQQIRLKLLAIYLKRKDTKTFASVASEVQNSGDAPAWEQAAAMGRKLEPGNPMYGSDNNAATGTTPLEEDTAVQRPSLDFDIGLAPSEAGLAAVDVPVGATPAAPAGLDFDLSFDAPAEAAAAVAEHESSVEPGDPEATKIDTSTVLDFDLGYAEPAKPEAHGNPAPQAAYESTVVLNAPKNPENKATENSLAEKEPSLDFDITADRMGLPEQQGAQHAKQHQEPAPSPDGLVFDVSATHPTQDAVVEKPAATKSAAKDESIDFTLDFPVTGESHVDGKVSAADPDQTLVAAPSHIDMSEINLNLDAPVSASAEEVKDAHWHDVATKLDLARAYQEMGDSSGAREILEEVLNEGDKQQRTAAKAMLDQLSA